MTLYPIAILIAVLGLVIAGLFNIGTGYARSRAARAILIFTAICVVWTLVMQWTFY